MLFQQGKEWLPEDDPKRSKHVGAILNVLMWKSFMYVHQLVCWLNGCTKCMVQRWRQSYSKFLDLPLSLPFKISVILCRTLVRHDKNFLLKGNLELWQLRLYKLLLSSKKKNCHPLKPTQPKRYKSNSPSCLSLTLQINRFVSFQNVAARTHFSQNLFFSVNKLRNPMLDLRLTPWSRWDLRLSGILYCDWW